MNKNQCKIAYLACPFSHSDPKVQQMRHAFVNRIALELHQKGKLVYSPLTHNIPLTQLSKKTGGWNAWGEFDRAMLTKCDELIVLTLPDWENSVGVLAEIELAKQLNLPIEMLNPSDEVSLDIKNTVNE